MGTIAVMAYGSHLQEIVLMNLHYGIFSNFIKLLYAVGMVVNLVMQLLPMLEVLESKMPRIFGYGTIPNENEAHPYEVYLYDPNNRSCCQAIVKFLNTLALVGSLLALTLYLKDFHVLLLVDGAILSNILVLMLPNAMYIHQANYGYLKHRESTYNFFVGCVLFYLSVFVLIYASFRGVQ